MKYGRELPGYPYNLKAKLTYCLWEVAGKILQPCSALGLCPGTSRERPDSLHD